MSSKAELRWQLAREALTEAGCEGVGAQLADQEPSKGVFELSYACELRGYSGWHWNVTVTQPDARKPAAVSEINLLAGPDAMLAPPWVPWDERLKEFRKQLRAEGKANSDAEADALIRDLVGSSHGHEAEDAEADADHGSVQPPAKTRVRKRLIKRENGEQGDDPEGNTEA
jgi:hypothetical protein